MKVDTAELLKDLERFLGRLSRRDYLAIYAASILQDKDPNEVAAELPSRLGDLEEVEENGRSVAKIKLRPDQITELTPGLPDFVIDLLLVDLEAFIHDFLTDAAGCDKAANSQPLESLVAKVWPADARRDAQEKKAGKGSTGRAEHWSYKDLILLSEIRNAIVHGDGEVLLARTTNRLQASGWTDEELDKITIYKRRSIDDLFRFKRAVRTLANEAINYIKTAS